MGHLQTPTGYSVFLASPDDLRAVRRGAGQELEDLSRREARAADVTIQVFAGEHALRGAGRPQDRINPDVDVCDLFVGMLWRRMGSASGAGGLTGFEEEFDRAWNRRERDGTPDILIALKKIDEDLVREPSDQVKRVLAFKERLRSLGLVYYIEFKTAPEFYRSLRSEVARRFILALRAEKESTRVSREEVVESLAAGQVPSPIPGAGDARLGQPPDELAVALERVKAALAPAPAAAGGARPEGPGWPDVERLYLLLKSWLSEGRTHEALTHRLVLKP